MLDEPRRPHIIELERKKWIHFDFHCSYHFALLVLDVLKVNYFQSVLPLQQYILWKIVTGMYSSSIWRKFEKRSQSDLKLLSKMADYFKFVWLSQNISSLPGDGESYLVQLALGKVFFHIFCSNEDVKNPHSVNYWPLATW